MTAEAEVAPAAQRADTTFEPDPLRRVALAGRGLLGRMAQDPVMLDAFHDAPDGEEVRDTHRKYLNWRHTLGEAHRADARHWLVVAGDPRSVRLEFGLRPLRGWPSGVYGSVPGFALQVVSVSALPATRDTLALRLFGRGRVLRSAGVELLALPEDAWERRLLPMLLRWRTQIPELPALRSPDEEDFVDNAQQILDEWERRATDRGLAPLMRQFERRLGRPVVEAEREVLRDRLGTLGPERLGDVVLDLSAADLSAWLGDPRAR